MLCKVPAVKQPPAAEKNVHYIWFEKLLHTVTITNIAHSGWNITLKWNFCYRGIRNLFLRIFTSIGWNQIHLIQWKKLVPYFRCKNQNDSIFVQKLIRIMNTVMLTFTHFALWLQWLSGRTLIRTHTHIHTRRNAKESKEKCRKIYYFIYEGMHINVYTSTRRLTQIKAYSYILR